MKKLCRKSTLIVALMLLLGFINVNAKDIYYKNLNGVNMNETEYQKIVNIFSEQKASILTQEEFDEYKDANIVDGDTIYQRAVYQDGEFKYDELISKEEYDKAEDVTSCGPSTRASDSGYLETTYKKLNVNLLDRSSNPFYLTASLTWKKVPYCRSYDVFAFRLTHFSYSGVTGNQTYFIGSNYTGISYNTSSEGYKGLSNGAGFSMNLKDGSNITSYEMSLSADLNINTSSYSQAHVYVAYEHAQSDLTRAQSMTYNLDVSGMGNVINFTDQSVWNKYDEMAGIHLTTPI